MVGPNYDTQGILKDEGTLMPLMNDHQFDQLFADKYLHCLGGHSNH